jgi:hypothetical protein
MLCNATMGHYCWAQFVDDLQPAWYRECLLIDAHLILILISLPTSIK